MDDVAFFKCKYVKDYCYSQSNLYAMTGVNIMRRLAATGKAEKAIAEFSVSGATNNRSDRHVSRIMLIKTFLGRDTTKLNPLLSALSLLVNYFESFSTTIIV